MKRFLVLSCSVAISALFFHACSSSDDSMIDAPLTRADAVSEKIVFQDDFNQADSIPDRNKWSLCKKGSPAWSKYLSERYDQAYVHDGKLVLVAEKVNGVYKTGGVQSLGKAEFQYGKIEICARFTKTAKGGWPAIWMMPAKPVYSGWPACGEIDIMEQLNHDGIVYQTIHSHYKNDLGFTKPVPTKTVSYNKGQFNIFGIEWTPEALTFKVNGATTLVYPNLHLADESVKKQWPFDTSFYLILNYALGGPGTWPGTITDSELPAKMEIDWVKVSQPTGR